MNNQISMNEDFFSKLRRKIVTAILSSLLFALIFSIGDFEGDLFVNIYYLNLLIVLTYGMIISFVGDWLSQKLPVNNYIRESASFLFHCFFGLAFFSFGIVSAISFFIVDRLLRKVKIGWMSVIVALLLVGVVFILLMNR